LRILASCRDYGAFVNAALASLIQAAKIAMVNDHTELALQDALDVVRIANATLLKAVNDGNQR
jgi:hypothetical protein